MEDARKYEDARKEGENRGARVLGDGKCGEGGRSENDVGGAKSSETGSLSDDDDDTMRIGQLGTEPAPPHDRRFNTRHVWRRHPCLQN